MSGKIGQWFLNGGFLQVLGGHCLVHPSPLGSAILVTYDLMNLAGPSEHF
jgi:hypothetical protein